MNKIFERMKSDPKCRTGMESMLIKYRDEALDEFEENVIAVAVEHGLETVSVKDLPSLFKEARRAL